MITRFPRLPILVVFVTTHPLPSRLRVSKRTAAQPSLSTLARSVPVFLIEDNRLLRDGLSAMLSAQGLSVLATARSGEEALREVARVKPQLVLLDSALGDRDSARFVKEVRDAFPDVRVIVMGLLPAHEDFVEFVKAGVAGFILKGRHDRGVRRNDPGRGRRGERAALDDDEHPVLPCSRPGPVPRKARNKGCGTDDRAGTPGR